MIYLYWRDTPNISLGTIAKIDFLMETNTPLFNSQYMTSFY